MTVFDRLNVSANTM